mgnify:CR=1 FL=1
MKVKDLIKYLSEYPQDLEIDITSSRESDFMIGGFEESHHEIADIGRSKTDDGKDVLEIHIW